VSALVEVEGLERRYGALVAVQGLSFTVGAGEIFGLLGPNGAGKTTALRMLATLLEPDAGSIRVCGLDPMTAREGVRRRIGYQTGDTRLYERLYPEEFLRYFGRLHDMEADHLERRIEALVESLELRGFLGRRCGALSTGQQQRVSIARALLHDPPVLILDEPTSGLDIISGQFLLDFLRQERDRGKAILYSTHIMSEAELICDRLGLLYEGRLIYEGSLGGLLIEGDQGSLTRAFLRHIAQQGPREGSHAAG
jgi:sodium transport system ATP-binding protein